MTQQSNNYPNYSDAILSKYEIDMRHFLMYDFNVSLKSMLIKYNMPMFEQYYFNSCRQTAVFGALVLNLFYPEYTYEAYEATFTDKLLGKPVSYEHCFIIAKHKELDRRILIDMARTTNPLVFEPIDDTHFYPDVPGYSNMLMVSYVDIPYEEVFLKNITEYLTGLPTQDFLDELLVFMDNYSNSMSTDKELLVERLYSYPVLKFQKFKEEQMLIEE